MALAKNGQYTINLIGLFLNSPDWLKFYPIIEMSDNTEETKKRKLQEEEKKPEPAPNAEESEEEEWSESEDESNESDEDFAPAKVPKLGMVFCTSNPRRR